MVGYVGSRGRNLLRLGDANLAPETIVNGVKTYQPQLGRRNPNFTGVWQRMTDAKSFYDSLAGVAEPEATRSGWRAQVSYTLSESTDDASGINSQDFSNNVQYVLRLVRPRARSRPVGVSCEAQPHGQRQLGPAVRRGQRGPGRRAARAAGS